MNLDFDQRHPALFALALLVIAVAATIYGANWVLSLYVGGGG